MKAAFILTARNKSRFVRDAVKTMLAQMCQPLDIVLSDQGSTDGTREILDEEASKYDGPHKVVRLNCPPEVCELEGMPGLNAHINWVMKQIDADVVLQISADDLTHPLRAAKVIEAFKTHKPSMVLTGMYYVDENLKYLGESAFPDKSGWCNAVEMHEKCIGGSASQAWSSEFFYRLGGLSGVGSQDVIMPFVAALDGGVWYIHERLHYYRACASLDNTGLEGVLRAIPEEDAARRLQVEELIHFQIFAGLASNVYAIGRLSLPQGEATQALLQSLISRGLAWCHARERLTLQRIPPLPLKA